MSISARSGFDPRLMAEAQAGSAMMANMATKTNPVQVQGELANVGANAKFPAVISSTDPEDDSWALRKNLVNNRGQVRGVGLAVADQSFFDYAKRKMDAQEEASFKAWVMQNADLKTPASAAWWYGKVPWLRETRENYINYAADLQKRDALITLNGPQSEEDFRFIFMKQNERIKIPTQPINELYKADLRPTYVQGFFSPFSQQIRLGEMPVDYQDKRLAWQDPTTIAGQGVGTLGRDPFVPANINFNPLRGRDPINP